MFKKNILILINVYLVFFFSEKGVAQSQTKMTLTDAINLAQRSSLAYKISKNLSNSSFWDFESYKARLMPRLSLNGTLPDYYRSISKLTLPNGQNDFVSQNVVNSSLSLNLNQTVLYTGGTVSISSSLQRIDNLGKFSNTAYTSIPLSVSYFQDNIFYNSVKVDQKVQPLKYKESQKQYIEDLEDIAYSTVDKFFNLMLAETHLKLDKQNLRNIDTLLKITNSRFEIGTVNLNDILQAKVSLLTAKNEFENAVLDLETTKQDFIRYLNIDKSTDIEIAEPDLPTFNQINLETAQQEAKTNRKYSIEFVRRKMEAQERLRRTISEAAPSISVQANIGVTQTGNTFPSAYVDLLRNQSLTVGLAVPIIDWGINKSNRKRAEAMLDLENANISQEELGYEQEVTSEVMKWNMLKEKADVTKQINQLAQKRYEIAKQKYALGTITFTDFNNSQLEKDKAASDFIENLRTFWLSYYKIRKITLYDFPKDKKIELRNQVE